MAFFFSSPALLWCLLRQAGRKTQGECEKAFELILLTYFVWCVCMHAPLPILHHTLFFIKLKPCPNLFLFCVVCFVCVGFFFSWASLSDESLACLRIFFSARKQLSISTPICAIVAIAQTGLLLGICCAGCRLLLPPFGTFSLRLPRLFRRGFLTANIHARLCFVWFFFSDSEIISLSLFFFFSKEE